VPTCELGERIGDIRERVRAAGWDTCLVVNGERVVLGRLFRTQLDGDAETPAETVRRSGPSTFRPNVSVEEMVRANPEHLPLNFEGVPSGASANLRRFHGPNPGSAPGPNALLTRVNRIDAPLTIREGTRLRDARVSDPIDTLRSQGRIRNEGTITRHAGW
jgi:hypothetical protein